MLNVKGVTIFFTALVGLIAFSVNLKAPREGCGPSSPKARCSNNLKKMGLVFQMFTYESVEAYYPALSVEPGKLTFCIDEIYPEYLTDLSILTCSSDSNALKSEQNVDSITELQSYWYLGATVWNEESGKAYIRLYKDRLSNHDDNDFLDLLSYETLEPDTLYQSPEKIYKLQNEIILVHPIDILNPIQWGPPKNALPILIERPGHHKGGAHVLFMDGHVEFVPYPGKFPMTVEFIAALEELESMDTQSLSPKGDV